MVVTYTQTTRGVSGSSSGPVTESKNPADLLAAKRFHHGVGGHVRRFEMHGNGLIAPGIFQLMASIGDVNKPDAKLARGIFKTSCLVTELGGEEQQSFGWDRHSWCISVPGSNKAISAGDGIFRQRHRGADGDQLVAGRLGAAVPRFAEERDARLGAR